MSREVITWILWLVKQQSVKLGTEQALTHAELALAAVEQLTAMYEEKSE